MINNSTNILVKVLLKKPWEYVLYKTEENKYIFSVVSGTVEISEVDVTLNADKIKSYENQGEVF
jgi:hypothetical protein